MGAYLSEPILEKDSTGEDGKHLAYGASSMQGWRVSQEDAHNSIISFDEGKSLFAVYDGHGGHEVAEYCSLYLPNYIKQNPNYKCGNYEKALEESFIAFDATLVDRNVVSQLKQIQNPDEKEEDEQEITHLCEEATMPIEDVIAKYNSDTDGEPAKALNPLIAGMKKKEDKPISPFLRGKSQGIGEGASGLNKHIRFTEAGDAVVENGVEETNGKETKENGVNGEKKRETPSTPVNGEKEEAEGSPEGSEKENKDTNCSETKPSEVKTEDIKGKGKGKGKGKSSKLVSKLQAAEFLEAVAETVVERRKKTASEIYSSLLKESPESGDEDDEDSEDEEFGAEVGSDDDDDDEDEDGEENLEGEEDCEDCDEDDSEAEDEEEEEEEEDGEMIHMDGFTEEPGNDSGCTAVVALLAGTKLLVANAGDSRCVVCRDGKAMEMSFDHKPEDKPELKRIVAAGGKVTSDGRVNGGLNLSRAIGDHAYKQNKTLPLMDQMISSQPDVRVLELDPEKDSWMILACDGIWNFMTSQEVVDYVDERIKNTPDDKLTSICEELFEHCLAPDTHGDGTGCDNMTAVIVRFKPSLFSVKDVIIDPSAASDLASAGGSSGSSSSTTASSALSEQKDSEVPSGPPAKKLRMEANSDE